MKLTTIIALCLSILPLAACSTMPTTGSPVTFYAEAGSTELDKADELDSSSERTVTVGVTYKQEPEADAQQNVTRGWVSDMSVSYSDGDHSIAGVDLDTQRIAVNLGLRYYFDVGTKHLQPYLGFGASPQMILADTSLGEDETGFAFAGYGALGIETPIGDHARLGLSYRHTAGAQFDLGEDENLNFNAGTLALTLGWSF